MLLLEKPDLSKQQTRRFPAASIEQAFLIRRTRVSGCLAEVIQWIQSRRAMGVMSDHNARATSRRFHLAPAGRRRQPLRVGCGEPAKMRYRNVRWPAVFARGKQLVSQV